MNAAKIIIAMFVIILFSNLLSSCAKQDLNSSISPIAIIQSAREIEKSVGIKLESETIDNTVNLKVYLDNPLNKPITSVQTWVSYNPKVLEGEKIETNNSKFELKAPYEINFDQINGIAMIGLANSTPITDSKIQVAEMYFDKKSDELITFDLYDYKDDLSGHSSANIMVDGTPYNILKMPEVPALIIEK